MGPNDRLGTELINLHRNASTTCVREAGGRRQGAQEVSVIRHLHYIHTHRRNDDCISMGISLKYYVEKLCNTR